jgi:hypothetical protein
MYDKMPFYFIFLSIFKLGIFIFLILNEKQINFNDRIFILVPLIMFLIIERYYTILLININDTKKK